MMNDFSTMMFSDIIQIGNSTQFVADNSSTGISATKSYFSMISDETIITYADSNTDLVFMVMACDDGVLNWVYGTVASVRLFVNKLNGEL